MNHTPGPWQLESGRSIKTQSGEFYITYGKDKYNNPHWKTSFSELDNNARLIAAAPELLETIESMYDVLSDILEDPNVRLTTQRYRALKSIKGASDMLAKLKESNYE